jgi:hypothetical protein
LERENVYPDLHNDWQNLKQVLGRGFSGCHWDACDYTSQAFLDKLQEGNQAVSTDWQAHDDLFHCQLVTVLR